MRHRVYGFKLGRNIDERNRLFKSLVSSLFIYGTITTSETKAKAIKGMVDKIINRAKLKKSFEFGLSKEILAKLGNRTSGYTSLLKVGTRAGDQTRMVKMSLIGAESIKSMEKVTNDKKQVTSKKTVKQITRRKRNVNK